MKMLNAKGIAVMALAACTILVTACSKDDNNPEPNLRTKAYDLSPVANSGVTGKVTFIENADHSVNLRVNLDNSATDTVHVVQLLNGSISSPGPVAVMLNNITGTGGAASSETMNLTQVMLADSSMMNVNYDSLLNFDGYVNVYYSASRMDSILAQTNIGSN